MLVGFGIDVAVDDEEVLPAVVVEIEEAIAEADERHGGLHEAGFVTDVGKVASPVVLEEHVVVVTEVGVYDGEISVVLVVGNGYAHVGHFAARAIERVAVFDALVFEGAVALVDEFIVLRGVVGDEEIGLAVVVDVNEESAEAEVSGGVVDPEFFAYVGE